MIYTASDFARRLGVTRQAVSNKLKRHIANHSYTGSLTFKSLITGQDIKVRFYKAEGSKKWLLKEY